MLVRGILLSIWNCLDPIYFSLTRLQYLCSDRHGQGVFRVRLTKYKGKEVVLSDGTKICKNDLLLKIHLHNVRLLQNYLLKNELAKGRCIFKNILESMPLLAEYVSHHPAEGNIKGVIGVTLINKGYRSLGFECIHPKNKYYSMFKKAQQIPIYLLSSSNISVSDIKRHQPVYLMMSKEKLLKKYT